MVTQEQFEILQETVEMQQDMISEAFRRIHVLTARAALNSPNKRMAVGVANEVVVKLYELESDDCLYKQSNQRKEYMTEEAKAARWVCWHLLNKLGGLTFDEIGIEYGLSTYVKKTANEIEILMANKHERLLIESAIALFNEHMEKYMYQDERTESS